MTRSSLFTMASCLKAFTSGGGDGVTGILVGNRQASSLASAVLEILEDPGWRERAAAQGPAFVSKKFGHQRMIDDTIAAYGHRDARHLRFELQKIGANR